ncbi:alpha/beta hydrolase [Bisgaard Taxon 10/6]|uniref:alpha/beta fold hydrolase n=1 Tax=Exercitatus varius TaxID=67857 RepID=UPI00294B26B1|nr:alpha/beta hydrolase [Exercitatus varius]MDG2916222.1 alpha/beta hydrolase [Exercitatus varius]MDG2952071.1 alpha/beta hydrolase [Exercitatus varius]MDG2957396.1 alpha/beta hydrolase [Exercitatus varius]
MLYEAKGSGKPIIFLPGLFAGGWIWEFIAQDVINKGFKVFTFKDAIPVAFGGSSRKAMSALDAIITECGDAPYLVGNSLGALIALHYASQNSENVKGVIMSGAPGEIENEAGVSINELKTGDKKYASILANYVFYDKEKVPPYLAEEIVKLFSNARVVRNMVQWVSFSRKYNVPEVLKDRKVSINFIWGEHDNITPISPWLKLAEQFDIPIDVIQNSGHSPMIEDPKAFTDVLLARLSAAKS